MRRHRIVFVLGLVAGWLLAASAGAEAVDTAAAATPAALREQAFSALWSENTPLAVELFNAYLETPDAVGDREAQHGLALAYSWDGRQSEAAARYRALLATDPADGQARVGLGRALLWDNRLGEGWAALQQAAADSNEATARDARDFQLKALDEYTPPLAMTLGWTWDSDELRTTRLALAGAAHAGGGALLQVMPSHTWYRQPGQPDAHALRLGVGLVTGLAPRWTLHAYGWLDRLRSDGDLPATGAPLDWDQPGADAWLTWLPAPRWRLDLGAGSQPVETYLAFGKSLERRQASLSVEHRPSPHWLVGVSGIAGAYTDANRSDRVSARAAWRQDGRWAWQVGPVASWLDFRNPYPGGYWAPADLRSLGLEASVSTRGHDVTWRLDGSVASEKEAGASAITVGSISARVGWRFAPDWLAAVQAGHSQGSFSTASGYRRNAVSLEIRAFF